jgi:hypothetical protein
MKWQPGSCLGILEDITERKEAESRLAFLTRAWNKALTRS